MIETIQVKNKKIVQFSQEITANRYISKRFTPAELAEIFHVKPRTVQRWMKSDDFPPFAHVHLALLTGAQIASDAFSGFYISDGAIFTPAGHRLTAGALETLAWRNQENRALWRRIELQEDLIKRLRTESDHWRAQTGAPIAGNDDEF